MLAKIKKATQGATDAILQAIKQDSENAFDVRLGRSRIAIERAISRQFRAQRDNKRC